ncbi:unnamed protein product [Sphagnum jensenii]|uniref:Secreted protein n=1 Tax=Sphagnum jensenii TaxID=128206 RepID=A0ABP0WLB9_9BRYO
MAFLRFLLLPLLIRGGVLSSTRVLGETLFVRGMTLEACLHESRASLHRNLARWLVFASACGPDSSSQAG